MQRYSKAEEDVTDKVGEVLELELLTITDEMERENVYPGILDAAAVGEDARRPPLLKQSTTMVVVFSFTYTVVCLLSLVNNSLAIAAIYRNRQLRTVTNYFLTNLAIADISVSIVVLPITLLSNLFSDWLFGAFLCKSVSYFQAVVVSASVNTLAAVAVERYLAVVHSSKNFITETRAIWILCVIWLSSLLVQLPWAIFYQQRTFVLQGIGTTTLCYLAPMSHLSERGFVLAIFILCYILPLGVLGVVYTLIGIKIWNRKVSGMQSETKVSQNIRKSKMRIVLMLIVVTIVFAVSWLPLYCIQIRVLFGSTMGSWEREFLQKTVSPLAQWLGSANSCVNPIIYCFFNKQFRKSFFTSCAKRK